MAAARTGASGAALGEAGITRSPTHAELRRVRTPPLHQYTVLDHQRTLSVAIAALAWGLASLFALRGLRLLPSIHIFNAAPTIKPELHLPHRNDHRLDNVADAVQRRPRPRP
ncbi:hypothetical protein ACWGNN_42090 [Streptomyces sp. NPDC055817]